MKNYSKEAVEKRLREKRRDRQGPVQDYGKWINFILGIFAVGALIILALVVLALMG